MFTPRASVSVANTALVSPSVKQASTASLNGGTIPAWWAATPGLEPGEEAVEPEHVEVGVGEGRGALVDDGADPGPLVGRREAEPGVEARVARLVAGLAAEDEGDGRQHRLVLQPLDDLDPPRA